MVRRTDGKRETEQDQKEQEMGAKDRRSAPGGRLWQEGRAWGWVLFSRCGEGYPGPRFSEMAPRHDGVAEKRPASFGGGVVYILPIPRFQSVEKAGTPPCRMATTGKMRAPPSLGVLEKGGGGILEVKSGNYKTPSRGIGREKAVVTDGWVYCPQCWSKLMRAGRGARAKEFYPYCRHCKLELLLETEQDK